MFISVVLNKLRASSLTSPDRPKAVSKKRSKKEKGGKTPFDIFVSGSGFTFFFRERAFLRHEEEQKSYDLIFGRVFHVLILFYSGK